MKIYADDCSAFIGIEGFEFIGENFVEKWNADPVFQSHGIQLDKAKSKWVKREGKWLGELKLLGISFDGDKETLTAKTRGRVATPTSEAKSPTEYLLETNYNLNNVLVNLITKKYPELKKRCEELKKVKDLSGLYKTLKSEFNTIIALIFQGGEDGRKPITCWEYEFGSLLDTIVRNKNVYLNNEINMTNFSSFLFSHLLDTLEGKYEGLTNILSLDKPKLKTYNFDWKPSIIDPYNENYIPPPYRPSIFYKKWKLMGAEEQNQWDIRYEEHLKQKKKSVK